MRVDTGQNSNIFGYIVLKFEKELLDAKG